MTAPREPRATLERALGQANESFAAADRRADQVGNVRLALALLMIGLLLTPLVTRSGTPWWGLIPAMLLFLGLSRVQDRWIRRRLDAEASVAYLEGSLARLGDGWRKLNETGVDVGKPWRDAELHFADDLDLFGDSSLFQLLCRARTRAGREILAAWMAELAPLGEARARQEAVRVLADDLDLRRRAFAAASGGPAKPLDDAQLLAWATGKDELPNPQLLRFVGIAFPVALIATAVLAFGFGGAREPFYLVLIAQVGLLLYLRRFIGPRAAVISGPERTLGRYARLIDAVESLPEARAAGPLADIHRALRASGRPASAELRGLERLVELLDARLNAFFAASLGPALMWDLNVVLRAERGASEPDATSRGGWRRSGPSRRSPRSALSLMSGPTTGSRSSWMGRGGSSRLRI